MERSHTLFQRVPKLGLFIIEKGARARRLRRAAEGTHRRVSTYFISVREYAELQLLRSRLSVARTSAKSLRPAVLVRSKARRWLRRPG